MENSAMVFDLRFVPDEVSFEGRMIRDSCRSAGLSLETYKPPDFIVKALQVSECACACACVCVCVCMCMCMGSGW